ncbi:MAG: YraN family protein [Coriobacteriia bacterium]|nr:YraN family protein [Coriobacteriia bacterium]
MTMTVKAKKQTDSSTQAVKSKPTQPARDKQNKRKRMGRRGETAACEFLVRQGLKIIDRNWRCGYGEADIIALDGHTLVFCEVRTKGSTKQGSPAESITDKKRERYDKLIQVYRSRTAIRHTAVRFDFIGIFVDEDKKAARLHYLRNA